MSPDCTANFVAFRAASSDGQSQLILRSVLLARTTRLLSMSQRGFIDAFPDVVVINLCPVSDPNTNSVGVPHHVLHLRSLFRPRIAAL